MLKYISSLPVQQRSRYKFMYIQQRHCTWYFANMSEAAWSWWQLQSVPGPLLPPSTYLSCSSYCMPPLRDSFYTWWSNGRRSAVQVFAYRFLVPFPVSHSGNNTASPPRKLGFVVVVDPLKPQRPSVASDILLPTQRPPKHKYAKQQISD
jgi:hypothetical protein